MFQKLKHLLFMAWNKDLIMALINLLDFSAACVKMRICNIFFCDVMTCDILITFFSFGRKS